MSTTAKIGNISITALVDVTPPGFDVAGVFPDVPESAWHAHPGALVDGKFQTNFSVFLVQSPDSTVLVDTGVGPGPHEALGGLEGRLMDGLGSAGVAAGDVDAVVFTHLHFDHIGWALKQNPGAEAEPAFSNARYVVSETEWKHWTQPSVMADAPFIEASVYPLERLGQLQLSGDETGVAPGMRTVATPGHTPGHQSVFIESDAQRGLIAGDLLHNLAQFAEPDWCAAFDEDAPTARISRKKWLEKAAADRMLMTFGHLLLDSNIGHVIAFEDRYRWQPV